VLVLPSELTHAQARACLQMLVQGLRAQSASVVVDASALQRFDSAALAVLLEFRRECLVAGKHFLIRGLTPRLADLAGLYGVAELLPAG
jgi:phospholipid transport system transporter-binding protein